MNSKNIRLLAMLLAVFCLVSFVAMGQEEKTKSKQSREFCSNNNYSYNNKISVSELRETTIPASSVLAVDGQRNGGVFVKGANRSDVLIRACINAAADTEEAARSLAKNIRIETGSTVRAEAGTEEHYSVSYEIHVPRQTNLKLTARNGGIGIAGVEGNMEFETVNGGLHLRDIAGDVRGRTANGGLHVVLSGGGWRGTGLNVETTNGGVHLSIPETYAANFETGTVNGGWHSDVAGLQVERKERHRGGRLNTALNGGGAPVRLVTTNGGVHINSNR